MAYTARQQTEYPFSHIITNAEGHELVRMKLPLSDTADESAADANMRPENMPVAELAQRIALSLTFCETAGVMQLAMGVRDGGLRGMAIAMVEEQKVSTGLRTMLVGLGDFLKEDAGGMSAEDRLKAVAMLIDSTGFARLPEVIALKQQVDMSLDSLQAVAREANDAMEAHEKKQQAQGDAGQAG